ncbi:MAG: methylmalonyl-CoA mutase [Patiriisocius sp.]|jgi:methylmalonyl-CoA mutase
MKNKLFQDFSPTSAKGWKQQIQADLKGADYNDALVSTSLEGIHINPFYHQDTIGPNAPAFNHPSTWNVGQEFFIDNEKITNKLLLDAFNRGAEAIILTATSIFKIATVLKGFDKEKHLLYFNLQFLDPDFTKKLQKHCSEIGLSFFIQVDPIHQLAKDGNWFQDSKKDMEDLRRIVSVKNEASSVSVDARLYHNAGCNTIQEIAYTISHAHEYLHQLQDTLSEKDTVILKMATGSNYFFEIAKLRALRLVFNSVVKEYHLDIKCHIISTPGKRNKTIYDYNINMLRTTTECMSAILGGADTVSNLNYDSLYHKDNEFGARIARNQLLILKEESYFDVVSNPSDGAYYIENLTNELAEKALVLFKEIEKNGGFIKSLVKGVIQNKIKEAADKQQQHFDQGEIVLLGTNKHPNENDIMKDDLELYPFVKQNPRKTSIIPIVEKRLAEAIEKERLEREK